MMSNIRQLDADIESKLFSTEEIETMLNRLATEITACYETDCGKRPFILISVLKGSFIFVADLIRKLDLPCQIVFLRASSYGASTTSKGSVDVESFPDREVLKGADVLLVEDILDSGRTLYCLSDILKDIGANSIRICTMLDKPARRVVPIEVDFKGFEVEDQFLVGYGLDYNETYRNLPYIGVLKPEIYS